MVFNKSNADEMLQLLDETLINLSFVEHGIASALTARALSTEHFFLSNKCSISIFPCSMLN